MKQWMVLMLLDGIWFTVEPTHNESTLWNSRRNSFRIRPSGSANRISSAIPHGYPISDVFFVIYSKISVALYIPTKELMTDNIFFFDMLQQAFRQEQKSKSKKKHSKCIIQRNNSKFRNQSASFIAARAAVGCRNVVFAIRRSIPLICTNRPGR